jgi:hypothetical protein
MTYWKTGMFAATIVFLAGRTNGKLKDLEKRKGEADTAK